MLEALNADKGRAWASHCSALPGFEWSWHITTRRMAGSHAPAGGPTSASELFEMVGFVIHSYAAATPSDLGRLMLVSKTLLASLDDETVVALLGLRKWLPRSVPSSSIMSILRSTVWPQPHTRARVAERFDFDDDGRACESYRCGAFHVAGLTFLRMSSFRKISPRCAVRDDALYMVRPEGDPTGCDRFVEICHIRDGSIRGRWIQLKALSCLRAWLAPPLAPDSNNPDCGAKGAPAAAEALARLSDKQLLMLVLLMTGLPREGRAEVESGRLYLALAMAHDDLGRSLAQAAAATSEEKGPAVAVAVAVAMVEGSGRGAEVEAEAEGARDNGARGSVQARAPPACLDSIALASDTEKLWMNVMYALDGVYGALREDAALASLAQTLDLVLAFHSEVGPPPPCAPCSCMRPPASGEAVEDTRVQKRARGQGCL